MACLNLHLCYNKLHIHYRVNNNMPLQTHIHSHYDIISHFICPNSPGRAEWLRVGTEAGDSISISFSKGLLCDSAITDILLDWNRKAKKKQSKI